MIINRTGIFRLYTLQAPRSFSRDAVRLLSVKPEPQNNVKPLSSFDLKMMEKVSNFEQSGWYRWTPRIFRPYMRGIMTRPLGFGASFLILHELTAIIPFAGLWWWFLHFDWIPLDVPQEFVAKGIDILSRKVINWDIGLVDKTKVVMAGANAYAATKLLLPVRLPISFVFAPLFDSWVMRPIQSAWSRFRNRKNRSVPKEQSNKEP